MLGLSSGLFSSKGMTTVPNLSGLSSSAAQSAIISAGLTFGQATTTSSGASSGNNGTVSSSSIASGSLVDYETSISIVLYSYSAPPPPPPPPPPPLPTLSAPALSLATSGNSAGGRYYQVINLTNWEDGTSYSPGYDNFEGSYPEYIVEGPAGSTSLTVTASRSGYNSNSSTIYFTLGPSAPPPPPPPPPPPAVTCSWSFGGYWDNEPCINGSIYSEAGYYEYGNCSDGSLQVRYTTTYGPAYCCQC